MKRPWNALAATSLLLIATLARAAWLGPWGNPVAPSFHGYPVALYGDGAGGVLVACQGAGVPGGSAIRLQHVLGDGTIAPGWPAEGAVACSLAVTTVLGELKALPDGSNGAYLLWNEGYVLRSGTYYVQHVLAGGARAAGWPARGRTIVPSGFLTWPESVPDGSGGVLVFWTGGGGVYSMRIRTDGTNAPGFPATGKQVLAPAGPGAQWSGISVAPAQGGGHWLSALLSSTDSLTTPWSYRVWRLSASGAPDLTWAGEDGLGFRVPTPSSAAAVGATVALDDGGTGMLVMASVDESEVVTHVLSDQSLDPAWAQPLLDLGPVGDGLAGTAGRLALDGAGGLYALWSDVYLGPERGWLRRARLDGTLDPAWNAPIPVSPSYQPSLIADAGGVFAGGARLVSCPHQDCMALNGLGRWTASGSVPAGWPVESDSYHSPGEYALPDTGLSGPVAMIGDGGGGIFAAWTTPDSPIMSQPYGVPGTVRVMRFQAAGPVAGIGNAHDGPLALRGARSTSDGIRLTVSGAWDGPGDVTVFDIFGRRVTAAELPPASRDLLVPGTRALPAGLYLVRLRAPAAEARAKVFVFH